MLKLLNNLLIHFGYKLTRVIPRKPPVPFKYNKLTKAEVSRRYGINYNTMSWVHVEIVQENPNITRAELIAKKNQLDEERRERWRQERIQDKKLKLLAS